MTFNLLIGPAAGNLHFIQEWRPVAFQILGVNELILFGLLFLALYPRSESAILPAHIDPCVDLLMLVHVRLRAFLRLPRLCY